MNLKNYYNFYINTFFKNNPYVLIYQYKNLKTYKKKNNLKDFKLKSTVLKKSIKVDNITDFDKKYDILLKSNNVKLYFENNFVNFLNFIKENNKNNYYLGAIVYGKFLDIKELTKFLDKDNSIESLNLKFLNKNKSVFILSLFKFRSKNIKFLNMLKVLNSKILNN